MLPPRCDRSVGLEVFRKKLGSDEVIDQVPDLTYSYLELDNPNATDKETPETRPNPHVQDFTAILGTAMQ